MYLHPLPEINSKYFNWKEFLKSPTADKLGIVNNPTYVNIKLNLEILSETLSLIREAFGKPIIINSGYRCPTLNKAVGGHPQSAHMTGRAADIRCINDDLTYQLYLFIEQRMKGKKEGIRKIILEKGNHYWIHFEME